MRRSVPIWLVFVLVLAAVGSGFAMAQAPAQTPAPAQPQEPRILSGADIGFRVEGVDQAGNPTGTLVVRIKGEWRPATSRPGFNRLTSR
jgi:hypothetical protein